MSSTTDGETEQTDAGSPPEAAAAPEAPRRTLALVLAVLAAIVIVLLAVALVSQVGRGDDLQTELDERDAIAATAGGAAEALLTYDYEDIDGTLERIQAYTGGDFSDTFEEIFNTVQVPVITDLQAKATAEVQFVYVSDIDSEGVARAVVVVNQTVQSTAGTRRLSNAYVQMELVRRGDRWVIESVPVNLSAQDESLTPPGGEAPAG
ncbi:MAG: hypothetical protein ACRDZU_07970 [Acidimicrobiales bacterium]